MIITVNTVYHSYGKDRYGTIEISGHPNENYVILTMSPAADDPGEKPMSFTLEPHEADGVSQALGLASRIAGRMSL